GLNTLVLAAAAASSSLAFRALRGLAPAWAMALGTAVGQLVAGALWAGVVFFTLRSGRGVPRLELFSGLVLALWIVGTLVESVVAFGIGRFLGNVHPALLPRANETPGAPAGAEA
ncbi:MAG TPA: hypothetical protein VGP93_10905, partial [Polyangiaceae bacterium]|nr:hypothetical protein [Polyangiaceae bacterium]